ncbi:uncharacterized protein BO97DRAFT_405817 [Aspergillus homomorphus CBS 101889]|uniref:Extracellular membrane protein CFEM domain-containing protein n=1 Tax=Aspergillus homomorphus (strain CBS 101889) TaxID=1450537 RepID=A0A395HZ12_ASPHC|nr:hypothetical protein BO97DRAFT_405817 [Aspergillus homomorphus CBS 101889]RAL12108.1 hypothetical protein BO97DRAFT_405817 [Aspergillus homomorphus CBS 101889]
MKFNSALALSPLLVLAVAQDSSTASSTASAATTTASLSPQAKCAESCASTDICCIAKCYNVPCPNDSQANDTTSCVAACPQGNGSTSETDAYASCQSRCVSSYFWSSATASAGSSASTASSNDGTTTTGSGSSSSSTGSSKSGSSKSGSSDSTSTATSSGAKSSETSNSAAITQLKMGVSTVGLLGFVLAAWAL